MRRRSPAVVAVFAGSLLLAACNDDGRALAPAPTVPVSPLTTPPSTEGTAPAVIGLTLTSTNFVDGDVLDPTFTCDGLDVSPGLLISAPPEGTAELAIAMVDLDADRYVHWVLAGLTPATNQLQQGVVPPGAVAARGETGVAGWVGPCPPEGDPLHTYEFTVYALPAPSGISDETAGADAIARFEQSAIATDTLLAFYGR